MSIKSPFKKPIENSGNRALQLAEKNKKRLDNLAAALGKKFLSDGTVVDI